VLEALHHVLAGGEVEVRILQQGQPDLVHELDQRAEEATTEANAIQERDGVVLSATV
jgi:hypothetical protein